MRASACSTGAPALFALALAACSGLGPGTPATRGDAWVPSPSSGQIVVLSSRAAPPDWEGWHGGARDAKSRRGRGDESPSSPVSTATRPGRGETQLALASLEAGVPLVSAAEGGGRSGERVRRALPGLETRDIDLPPVGTKLVRSMVEIRRSGVVLQQWDISCGAAALATVLNYQHGFPVTELEIADEMLGQAGRDEVRARGGFSLLDLKRYVQAHGFVGAGYAELSLGNLEAFGPTIVPIWVNALPHFVVVRGRIGDRVVLADPAYGNRTMPVERFEQVWQSKIGFVVMRADGSLPETQLAALSEDYIVPTGDVVRSALTRR